MTYTFASTAVRVLRVVAAICIVASAALLAYFGNNNWQILFAVETGLVALVLVLWVFGWAQRAVDQRYKQETRHAEKFLSDLGHAIAGVRDTRTLLSIAVQRLVECLHAEPIAVLLLRGETYELAHSSDGGARTAALRATSPVLRHLQRLQGPGKLDFADPQSWVNGLPDVDKEALLSLQACVLTPMIADRRIVGLISTGPKRWDMPYPLSDLQLLTAAGSQVALALENSRLTDDIRAQIAARERLDRELEIAREVQQRLFPQTLPVVNSLDFAGYCRPASDVGGDYYDFIRLDDGSLGIAIGDVSGKGIAAALMMASLQASLRGQTITPSRSLGEMIERINRLVYEASSSNRYATFFYAEYQPSSYTLRYVNAGHNPPILMRGCHIHRLEEGGTVIGLFPGAPYREEVVQLRSGDVLIAFTDGISEAMDGGETEWGEENIIASLEHPPSRSAAELVSAILDKLDRFTAGAPQHDDMTLVAIRVR